MIDNSDNGFGDVGPSAFPADAERREAASYHPRPFTAWPTARDGETESLWTRTRGRLARLFRRNGLADNHHHPVEDQPSGDAVSGAVTPPEDFEFPWSRPEEGARVSGATSRNGVHSTDDLPMLETFGSVDEALPAADVVGFPPLSPGAPVQSSFEADTDPMIEPARPADTPPAPRLSGLLSKLFNRETEEITEEVAPPAVEESNPDFFVTKFRAFYNEVLHQKHKGTDITAGFATAILSSEDASGDTAEQAAQAMSSRLQQMLELQQAEATWMGGETAARYQDAQYAMAVLADETLAAADWKGSSAWKQQSLEQKLFKSHAADLEFFRRVDRLFKEGPPTPVSRDLARVYLLTIAAGFRGKYAMFGLTRALHEYRQRLFEYIHGGDALLLYDENRRIFPEAAAHTLAGRATARVSKAQRWVAVLILMVVGYTILAHVAWNSASADLRDVTARVEATNSAGSR